MTGNSCAIIRRWLLAQDNPLPETDTALSYHVAGCVHCRGMLALLLADQVVAPPDPIDCDTCLHDLPAYQDVVHAHGPADASRLFPAVWWHLWTCGECAHMAEQLKLLIEADTQGVLPSLPTRHAQRSFTLRPFRIDRAFLHALFGPQLQLGASWNADDDALFLAEHTLLDCHMTIYLLPQSSEYWDLTIIIEPPIQGVIVVSFGEKQYHSELSQGRNARVCGIPATLLAGDTGPDLLLQIERDNDNTSAGA